jgi:hypothetical protein
MQKISDVYIPESPNSPGTYANEHENTIEKLSTGKQISTHNPYMARKFNTKLECQQWCDSNPFPRFVPMEHSFVC